MEAGERRPAYVAVDAPEDAERIVAWLASLGRAATRCDTPARALAAAEAEDASLAVLDADTLAEPAFLADAVRAAARRLAPRRGRLALVGGDVSPETLVILLEAGADVYLAKPLAEDAFLEMAAQAARAVPEAPELW